LAKYERRKKRKQTLERKEEAEIEKVYDFNIIPVYAFRHGRTGIRGKRGKRDVHK